MTTTTTVHSKILRYVYVCADVLRLSHCHGRWSSKNCYFSSFFPPFFFFFFHSSFSAAHSRCIQSSERIFFGIASRTAYRRTIEKDEYNGPAVFFYYPPPSRVHQQQPPYVAYAREWPVTSRTYFTLRYPCKRTLCTFFKQIQIYRTVFTHTVFVRYETRRRVKRNGYAGHESRKGPTSCRYVFIRIVSQ